MPKLPTEAGKKRSPRAWAERVVRRIIFRVVEPQLDQVRSELATVRAETLAEVRALVAESKRREIDREAMVNRLIDIEEMYRRDGRHEGKTHLRFGTID